MHGLPNLKNPRSVWLADKMLYHSVVHWFMEGISTHQFVRLYVQLAWNLCVFFLRINVERLYLQFSLILAQNKVKVLT
jgi:hypothetical protein